MYMQARTGCRSGQDAGSGSTSLEIRWEIGGRSYLQLGNRAPYVFGTDMLLAMSCGAPKSFNYFSHSRMQLWCRHAWPLSPLGPGQH